MNLPYERLRTIFEAASLEEEYHLTKVDEETSELKSVKVDFKDLEKVIAEEILQETISEEKLVKKLKEKGEVNEFKA